MFLSRRDVLRGMGATIALPFLEAMDQPKRPPLRLICIEQVHGAAGSSIYGAQQNLWAPATAGRDFDLSPTSLKPLDAWREHVTIISNCDVPSADPTDAREIGGDHFRSSATWLTQTYPKRTDGEVDDEFFGSNLVGVRCNTRLRQRNGKTPTEKISESSSTEATESTAKFVGGLVVVDLDGIDGVYSTQIGRAHV